MFFVIRLEAFQDCLKTISGGHAFRHVQTEVAEDSGVFLLNIFFTPSVRVEQPPVCIVVARVFSAGVEENVRVGMNYFGGKTTPNAFLANVWGQCFP